MRMGYLVLFKCKEGFGVWFIVVVFAIRRIVFCWIYGVYFMLKVFFFGYIVVGLGFR